MNQDAGLRTEQCPAQLKPADSTTSATFAVRDYNLAATLNSGQTFRWRQQGQGWIGIIGDRWVRLRAHASSLTAGTAEPVADWNWLKEYLQLDLDLETVLRTFPADEPMQAAVAACRGLRLLRQEPWECLASFILSSTKQISQIRQIIARLSECFGRPVAVPPGQPPAWAFPSAVRLAETDEADLRACKMGFRAPFLLAAARRVAGGELNLPSLRDMPPENARAALMRLPGVGPKIANCVLLFAYGFQSAFPVDVWINKALRRYYFGRGRVKAERVRRFADSHFGPHAGYAQQYLFHYMRTQSPRGMKGK